MAASDANMTIAIRMRIPPTLPPNRPALSVWAINRLRSPSRRDTRRLSSVASVMMPKPPICDSTVIRTWPKVDQYVGVSTTARPVTLTEEVAVNRAVMNGAFPGSARAAGSIISRVPTTIAPRKAKGTMRAGYRHSERFRTRPPLRRLVRADHRHTTSG